MSTRSPLPEVHLHGTRKQKHGLHLSDRFHVRWSVSVMAKSFEDSGLKRKQKYKNTHAKVLNQVVKKSLSYTKDELSPSVVAIHGLVNA